MYQAMTSNAPIKIRGIEITQRTKRLSDVLKKKTVNTPIESINNPPNISHLKAINIKINNISHGKALGEL